MKKPVGRKMFGTQRQSHADLARLDAEYLDADESGQTPFASPHEVSRIDFRSEVRHAFTFASMIGHAAREFRTFAPRIGPTPRQRRERDHAAADCLPTN
jgi:hypothetical protein